MTSSTTGGGEARRSTSNRPQGFGKQLHLRRRAEFLKIQQRGRKRHTANFVVACVKQSPPEASRFGFSVSRRVGNAVVRNRVKRRLREFVRIHRAELAPAADFVFIAKPGAAELSYAELVAELRTSLGS